MPPRSYLITAAVLVVLVAISLSLTMGFSIFFWRWLLAAAGCILIVLGTLRVVRELGAPPWIGIALASPGLLWAVDNLRAVMSDVPTSTWISMIGLVTFYLALLAAAAGALKLVEIMWRPHVVLQIGYGVLAAAAFVMALNWFALLAGWSFTRNATYSASVRPLNIAATLIEYGAFAGAALLVTMRRKIEIWTGAAICLIAVYMLYEIMRLMFATELRGNSMFWVQPILMLIGGAAIWRIGSVLHAQAASERNAQS